METGRVTASSKENFVEDCTVETDKPAFIPDTYIDITAEKIRIYKQLDSLRDDRDIDLLSSRIEDRFGPLPEEVKNLVNVVKIRNRGSATGFEKIIIKNGMQIMFFVSNPMSAYYQSKEFEKVIAKVNENESLFKFNQDGGKLRTVSRGVDTLDKALVILKKLQ